MVVAAETGGALGGMVRQLSIDQFENEGRRVGYGTPESATAARKLLDRQQSINSVPKKVNIFSPKCSTARKQYVHECGFRRIAKYCFLKLLQRNLIAVAPVIWLI